MLMANKTGRVRNKFQAKVQAKIQNRGWFSDNKWILLLFLAVAILCFYPAMKFDLPVVQTDGASQYIYAKTLADTGSLNSDNPIYNQYSSLEKKISDYPPFMPASFAVFIKVFGNGAADTALINGVFGGIFILFGLFFIYVFAKELTGSKGIAAIVLLFAVLNVRMYFMLFVGMFSSVVAFALFFPALYFALKFFKADKFSGINFGFALLFNILVFLTYPIFGIYLLFIESLLWLGLALKNKLNFSFPQIKLNFKPVSFTDFKKYLYFIIPALAVFIFVLLTFALNTVARSSWVGQWISALLGNCPGYQCVWGYFLIADGILFVLFAAIGIFYLIYKQDWPVVFLFLAGLFIVLFKNWFVTGDVTILIYLYRFYVIFFVLMAIPAAMLVYDGLRNINTKKLTAVLFAVCILLQVLTIGMFMSFVQPALSHDEYDAAIFLKENPGKTLFFDNKEESAQFRSFKWVVVYSQQNVFDVLSKNNGVTALPLDFSDLNYDNVFISDVNSLGWKDKTLLDLGYVAAFENGSVAVYSKK